MANVLLSDSMGRRESDDRKQNLTIRFTSDQLKIIRESGGASWVRAVVQQQLTMLPETRVKADKKKPENKRGAFIPGT